MVNVLLVAIFISFLKFCAKIGILLISATMFLLKTKRAVELPFLNDCYQYAY